METKTRESDPSASLQRRVRRLTGTPPETQQQLVDLWLSSEPNTAKLILAAFRIGVEEGKRAERCGEPDTILGVQAAFKQIMDSLPPESPNDKLTDC